MIRIVEGVDGIGKTSFIRLSTSRIYQALILEKLPVHLIEIRSISDLIRLYELKLDQLSNVLLVTKEPVKLDAENDRNDARKLEFESDEFCPYFYCDDLVRSNRLSFASLILQRKLLLQAVLQFVRNNREQFNKFIWLSDRSFLSTLIYTPIKTHVEQLKRENRLHELNIIAVLSHLVFWPPQLRKLLHLIASYHAVFIAPYYYAISHLLDEPIEFRILTAADNESYQIVYANSQQHQSPDELVADDELGFRIGLVINRLYQIYSQQLLSYVFEPEHDNLPQFGFDTAKLHERLIKTYPRFRWVARVFTKSFE